MIIFTATDILSALVFFVIILAFGLVGIKDHLTKKRCKHLKCRENMSCDAICQNCGKNLGFIGNVRAKNKGGEI